MGRGLHQSNHCQIWVVWHETNISIHSDKLLYGNEMNGNLELGRFFAQTFYPKGCDLDLTNIIHQKFNIVYFLQHWIMHSFVIQLINQWISTFAKMVLELIRISDSNNWDKWNKQFGALFHDDSFERWENKCVKNGFGVLNSFLNDLQLKAVKYCNWTLFKIILNFGVKKNKKNILKGNRTDWNGNTVYIHQSK